MRQMQWKKEMYFSYMDLEKDSLYLFINTVVVTFFTIPVSLLPVSILAISKHMVTMENIEKDRHRDRQTDRQTELSISIILFFYLVCRKTDCVEEVQRLKKVCQRGLQLLKQNYIMVSFYVCRMFFELYYFSQLLRLHKLLFFTFKFTQYTINS